MKICLIEPIGISPVEFKNSFPGHEVLEIDSRGWPDDKLLAAVRDADILALTNRPLNATVIGNMPNLKLIAVAFTGVDHVDARAASSGNVTVMNAVGYARTAVAELVFGLMISLARRIPENNQAIREGAKTNTGIELGGKTLGIIGYGAIGREVDRLAAAFKMNTLIFSRRGDKSLSEVFSASDFVTIHVPLTSETRGMISLKLLESMKTTSYLVNCARGPIVNTGDLVEVLKKGKIAGAALDVFDVEPPLPSDYSLLSAPNVIATPHIGFNTKEALAAKGRITLGNIHKWLSER